MDSLNALEELAKENIYLQFDSDCVRKRSNISKASDRYKFDHSDFQPQVLLNDAESVSPKLNKLLENIQRLDKMDMEKDKHLYKHFIFCDIKSNSYGAKLLASALIASGKTLGYYAKRKDEPSTPKEKTPPVREDTPRPKPVTSFEKLPKEGFSMEIIEEEEEEDTQKGGQDKPKKKKEYQKIKFVSDTKLKETKNDNFFLLCSNDVYDQKITVKDKKHILQTFNERPQNVHGETIRFIIMDSGFKEGIDLFDVKYVHIFEPSINAADQKQVIGRGTRTCGQKGLQFHPTRGWPLHVFVYDLEIEEKLQDQFLGAKSAMDLYLKSLNVDLRLVEFGNDLEKTLIYGAVDHDLTKSIHEFKLQDVEKEVTFGGGPKRKPSKLILQGKPSIILSDGPTSVVLPSGKKVPGQLISDLNFDELRKYVNSHFQHCSWKNVKMENLCEKKPGQTHDDPIIEYTPTQRFVQEYFTPQAPVKGMLLWHSVGTGKTCSAIASSTASFVPQGYTILWVTRTTLKSDIWKNMFGQICNEQIRKMVRDGVELPKDHSKRMRLLSNAWKIRPLSYKQFSNLVSKENDYYRKLVDINGEEDPLRKTLLIIDEAHKLYGGGDLSAQERPDMKKLHNSIMHSYSVSGSNSVRVLLMTATPITEDPMEIIKLLNLCKPWSKQLTTKFDSFSLKYLDEQGKFTKDGREKFLNDNAGYLSYLNREKDARQFAQPILHHVNVPMVEDIKTIEKMDKRFSKSVQKKELETFENRLKEEQSKIDEDLRDLDRTRFFAIKDVCKEYEGKVKRSCEKIANQNIKRLVEEIKAVTLQIKENVKQYKTELKEKKTLFKDIRKEQKLALEKLSDEEKKIFQDSVYYMLKYKCGKKQTLNERLEEYAKEHPYIREMDRKIRGITETIQESEQRLKELGVLHKNKIIELKNLLKESNNLLEKSAVRVALKETRKQQQKTMKARKKEESEIVKELSKELKDLQSSRKKKYNKLRKKVKSMKNEKKQLKKEEERTQKALRKTLRKTGELREEFKGDFMKERIAHYQKDTEIEFDKIKQALIEDQKERDEKKALKEAEREEKRRIKEAEREEKRRIKEAEKEKKDKIKALEKARKEAEKTRKKREKEMAKKNKTKKEKAT